jgi:hypothetical protein
MSRDQFLERRTKRRADDSDAMGHVWHDEPSSTIGETLRRCSRCHCCAHWPLASQPCAAVHIAGPSLAERGARRKRPSPNPRPCAVCGEPSGLDASGRARMTCGEECRKARLKRSSEAYRSLGRDMAESARVAAIDAEIERVARSGEPETDLQRVRREQRQEERALADRLASMSQRQRDRAEKVRRQSEKKAANYAARKARWELEAREPEGLAAG